MHFGCLVLIDAEHATDRESVEQEVERLMAPYDENAEGQTFEDKADSWSLASFCEQVGIAKGRVGTGTEKRVLASGRDWQESVGIGLDTLTAEEKQAIIDRGFAEYVGAVVAYLDDEGDIAVRLHGNSVGKWDWFQIGGRWTGSLVSDYNPTDDAANVEECSLCGGTGTRPDGLAQFGAEWVKSTGGCNGCSGKGTRAKWPTEWAPFEGDVQPVASLDIEKIKDSFFAVVTPTGQWIEEGWDFQDTFDANFKDRLATVLGNWPNAVAVVVDYHS